MPGNKDSNSLYKGTAAQEVLRKNYRFSCNTASMPSMMCHTETWAPLECNYVNFGQSELTDRSNEMDGLKVVVPTGPTSL